MTLDAYEARHLQAVAHQAATRCAKVTDVWIGGPWRCVLPVGHRERSHRMAGPDGRVVGWVVDL